MLTTEEKHYGNILIAEFVGWKRHNHGSYFTWENEKGEHIFESVLQYDSSYNWLMPIVEKIESIGEEKYYKFCFTIRTTSAQVTYTRSGRGLDLNSVGNATRNISSDTKMEAIFKTVIEFIKWYKDK